MKLYEKKIEILKAFEKPQKMKILLKSSLKSFQKAQNFKKLQKAYLNIF